MNCESGVENALHYLRQRKDIAFTLEEGDRMRKYELAAKDLQSGNPDPAAEVLLYDRHENRNVKRFVKIIDALLDELAAKYGGQRIWGTRWQERQEELATGRPRAIASRPH